MSRGKYRAVAEREYVRRAKKIEALRKNDLSPRRSLLKKRQSGNLAITSLEPTSLPISLLSRVISGDDPSQHSHSNAGSGSTGSV
jgi:hypothetical protein